MSNDDGSKRPGHEAARARAQRSGLAVTLTDPAERVRLPLVDEAREIDRRLRPIYVVWETTLACDMACRHCGSRAGRGRVQEMDTAECVALVDQMADLGVLEVTLTGGETYLREDWTEIVRAVRARSITCSMVTAGRGMDAERARAAAAAGLQSVSVSIDGLEATHERVRGIRGSYQGALSALRNLRDAGLKISVNTQINRASLRELPALLEVIIEAGIFAWQIQLTLAMGRAADDPELVLQPYDMLELAAILPVLAERCKEAGVILWPGNNIGYFGTVETALRGTMPRGHWSGCGGGRALLGIEADGTVKACGSLPTAHWTAGNVREEPLRDIWERAPTMRYTRDRTDDDLWGFCHDCYYASVCRAGCTSTAFVLFGRAGNNPYCVHRAQEMERAHKRERLLQVEVAPGAPMDHGRFEIVVEDVAG